MIHTARADSVDTMEKPKSKENEKMSMYNLLFGVNPNSDSILGTLNLTKDVVERFRDCYIEGDKICVYTRTGGGNREDYPNETLTNHPNYLYDEDDDYDSTYASFYFKFPQIEEDESK